MENIELTDEQKQELVLELRKTYGVGNFRIKQALVSSNYNVQKAVEFLKKNKYTI